MSDTDVKEAPAPSAPPERKPRLLLVDDEINVLRSLQRLLRPLGAEIETTASGVEALIHFSEHPFDLIVSDMCMPEMSGAELLAQIATQWPATIRILLTGNSDVEAAIQAVNQGRIYHYATKPWDNREFLLLIHKALEKKRLEDAQQRLHAELAEKNRQLAEWNSTLEEKVRQRTAKLRRSMERLNLANEQLRHQFYEIIKVLSQIIELHPSNQPGLAKTIADQSKRIGEEMGMSGGQLQNLLFACLLFQLGRITLPERLNDQAFYRLEPYERQRVLEHAQIGEGLLNHIAALQEVAVIIRAQHEKYDGTGVPDGLRGKQIPLGARILAVVRDYNLQQRGIMTGQSKNVADSQRYIERNINTYYDAEVVETLFRVMGRVRQGDYQPMVLVKPEQLRPGMEVIDVRDRISGRVYLRGGTLDKGYIDRILELWHEVGVKMEIRIKAQLFKGL